MGLKVTRLLNSLVTAVVNIWTRLTASSLRLDGTLRIGSLVYFDQLTNRA